MTTNGTLYAAAFRQFLSEMRDAATYTDRDLTHSGTTRQRARRMVAARNAFRPKIPTSPEGAAPADPRPAVFDGLAPQTADQVAVNQHEWATVEAALGSGRGLQQMVAEATSTKRLAAIANNAEAWAYGQETKDPEGVADEVRSQVFDRLVQLGHEGAVRTEAEAARYESQVAWNRVMTEAMSGDVSLAALTELHRWDPDGHREVAAATQEFDPSGEVGRTVALVDGLVVSGRMKLED